MALQGDLADLPFEDLLHIITRKNQRAILQVESTKQRFRASVVVEQSQLYSAWLSKDNGTGFQTCYRGEDVLLHLLNSSEGEFTFDVIPSTYSMPERNVFKSIHEILLANLFKGTELSDAAPLVVSSSSAAATSAIQTNNYGDSLSRTANSAKDNRYAILPQSKPAYYTQVAVAAPVKAKPAPNASKPRRNWLANLVSRLSSI